MESVPGNGPKIDFGIGDLLIAVAAFLLVFTSAAVQLAFS